MTALDRLIPAPRRLEVDEVDLALSLPRAWELLRHGDLGQSRLTRALFRLRALPARLTGAPPEPVTLRLDDLVSTPERPGFCVLVDDAPHEVAVGAIGKVWMADIPFVHAPQAADYLAFAEPGYVKVAWALRFTARGENATRVAIEVRVDATDDASWEKFRAYFRLIGPASHFIRRSLLSALAREYGTPESRENEQPLPGDELLADALGQVTHGITIAAKPEAIWPWLVQMGCRRGGFYSIDLLDNGGRRSAREIHPELQSIAVGDVLPATPKGNDGFEVLHVDPNRALVLGGLYDGAAEKQLPFAAPRPKKYWQTTWAFVLEPEGEHSTRLHVRGRAACPEDERLHLAWMRFLHAFMEPAQLRGLSARVEGRLPRDDFRDVLEGVAGAGVMALCFFTPFLRDERRHWGLTEELAARDYPGDDLVPHPTWSWTHGIEIDAPAAEVWPWLAQIGGDKGGFYSYQALENLVGCRLSNAEIVHPEWEAHAGDTLELHPRMPGPKVVAVEPGHHFVVHAPPDPKARAEGRGSVTMSWLFFVETLGAARCRAVSRYRVALPHDLGTRVAFGPTLLEPVGFAMDRRMLIGLKERAEGVRAKGARAAGAE